MPLFALLHCSILCLYQTKFIIISVLIMTAKIKTIRQLEDMTQKLLPNPQKVKNQLSKIKEETGETVFSTYTMLHEEKEREQIINEGVESDDVRMIHPDNLPTVRVGVVRPVTAPSKTSQNRKTKLPSRPKSVQEERPTSTGSDKGGTKEKIKKSWGSAFQKIKIIQSLSGGIQIEGGRSNSRLRRRVPTYQSPDYAYIKPIKRDVRQENFADMQAAFWAEKFKQLIESWESDDKYKLRLRDILPRDTFPDKNRYTSRAAHRMNEFIRNYGMKYKWAFVRSSTPMADMERSHLRSEHVPIRHSELAAIQDDMKKRVKETELLIIRSQTILKEVDSLTRLTKKAYEPPT